MRARRTVEWFVYAIHSSIHDPEYQYSWTWDHHELLGTGTFYPHQKARGFMRLLREKGWLEQQKEIHKFQPYGPCAAVIFNRKTLQPLIALIRNTEPEQ